MEIDSEDLHPKSTSSERLVEDVQALGLPKIGSSSEGRPLCAGQWGGEEGPCLLVIGGIHGNEPSSVAGALDVIAAARVRPPGSGSLHVVPVLNPDGIIRGSKDSARGVDLNRNFPARSFSPEHPPRYFPGPHPLSEPETQALAALIDVLRPTAVVALHAPLACINYDGPALDWATAVARACGWPVQADIGYPTPGSLGSWLGVDRGLPVLTIEFPAGEYADFRLAAQAALQTAINPGGIR